MGLFRKAGRSASGPSSVAPMGSLNRARTFPGQPPEGFLRTPLIASTNNGHSVAHFVGIGQKLFRTYSSEGAGNDHVLWSDATKDLEFALGFSDEPRKPVFKDQNGESMTLMITWDQPLSRSTEAVQDRISALGGVDEILGASIHGILSKGMKQWTLAVTDKAVYALPETGQDSLRISLKDVVEIRLNHFDLAIGEFRPEDSTYERLHEFFHVRYETTWKAFCCVFEEMWVRANQHRSIRQAFGVVGEITVTLISLQGRLFISHIPIQVRDIRDSAIRKGLWPNVDAWINRELDNFRQDILRSSTS